MLYTIHFLSIDIIIFSIITDSKGRGLGDTGALILLILLTVAGGNSTFFFSYTIVYTSYHCFFSPARLL